MATAWPAAEIGSYLSGDEAQAAFPEAVWDRLKVCLRMGGTVDLDSVTSGTSTAWVQATAFDMYIPEVMRAGDTLKFYFYLSRTGGTNAYGRMTETGVPTNGTEATTPNTTPTVVVSSVTVAAGWAGTVRNFNLEARGDGVGTSTADGGQIVANVKGSD